MSGISFGIIVICILAGALIGYFAAFFFSLKKKQDPFDLPEVKRLSSELEEKNTELKQMRNEHLLGLQENSALKQKNSDLEKSIEQRKEELERTRKELQRDFENIANKIFEEKGNSFRKNSELSIRSLLEPFDKNIAEFKKTVGDTYEKGLKERTELQKELAYLKELNQTMTEEARELTQALKGENKTQGNWGELILERIMENSGLRKGEEYDVQYSTTLEDGTRIQPDVIVKLPDDKHVIIDSKVSLKAYEQYFNAKDEAQKQLFLKAHLESLKSHIKGLHEKAYTSARELNSPDFVLLFLPIEASFGMAIQADSGLYDYAWKQKIVIVTPSTLLATLRTIASIWKHEQTNQNAAEIARQAGALYDKFAGIAKNLKKVDTQFDTARKTLHQTVEQLSEGRGNLIARVEKLREMGATTKKSLKEENRDMYLKGMDESGENYEDDEQTED